MGGLGLIEIANGGLTGLQRREEERGGEFGNGQLLSQCRVYFVFLGS